MVETARKFATEEEAWQFIRRVGDTPEGRAVAEAWEWDWDEDIAPELVKPKADPKAEPLADLGELMAQAGVAKGVVEAYRQHVAGRPKPVEEEPAPPEPDPEPQEAEPQAEPEEEIKEAAAKPKVEFAEPATLSQSAPYDIAKEYIKRHCQQAGMLATYFWQGEFWEWNGRHYEELPSEEIRSRVYNFLDKSRKQTGQSPEDTARFRPTPKHVNDVIDGLKALVVLDKKSAPPMWLDTGAPARDVIVFQNAVVYVATGKAEGLTPRLWVHSALEFDWNPKAKCPVWDKWLGQVHPGDREAVEFAEEWLGYNMTEEIKFQKGAMLIGKPRSGKGTYIGVMEKLVGRRGFVSLRFDTWTATENSQQPMIGKRSAVFPDVRLKEQKFYGKNRDGGGLDHKSVQLLLSIIGGDPLTIGRKNREGWEGRLATKISLMSNVSPNLNDRVLPTRFVKLGFGVSFLGREDVDLPGKLAAELPGIAVKALAGYRRLLARGRFIQPRSADRVELEVLRHVNPFEAMVKECFIVEPDAWVKKTDAYAAFTTWCEENDRPDVSARVTPTVFTKKLKPLVPNLDEFRPSGEPRRYVGLRLR